MAWAIDKKEIVDTALFGVGGIVASGTAIPPGNFYAFPHNPYERADVDRAKRLLAESGRASGVEAELYVTSTYDFLRTPAEIIQAQLAKAGIRVKITAADWSVYLPTVFQKKYALTVLGTSGQVDPDDFLYPNFHSRGGTNFVNYADAQFDQVIEQGRAASERPSASAFTTRRRPGCSRPYPWSSCTTPPSSKPCAGQCAASSTGPTHPT